MDTTTNRVYALDDLNDNFTAEELAQKIDGHDRFVPVYSNESDVPRKFRKLVAKGRWHWLTKMQGGAKYIIGVRRKSTGEERYL